MREFTIAKKGAKFVVKGHNGDIKGEHDTKEQAVEQLAAIHANMKEANRMSSRPYDVKLYVVVYPTNVAELGDLWFTAYIDDIILQAKGGLEADDVAGVFTDKDLAKAYARKLYKAELARRKRGGTIQEMIFGANDEDREPRENAIQALLGSEDIDVSALDDEELEQLLQSLAVTEESVDRTACEIISVLRENSSSDDEIIEALAVNMGLHLHEAREIFEANK